MNVTIKGNKLSKLSIDNDSSVTYWTDGRKVYFRHYEIRGADIDTFEWYDGRWAKDFQYCYCSAHRLKFADPKTFVVINIVYAKDKSNVWSLGGSIQEVDIESFEVCDSGIYKSVNSIALPYGFAKDKKNVYYTEFSRKATIVKKANPVTFHSLDDGFFAYDDKAVFFQRSILPKANPTTWKKLHEVSFYSKCDNRIYFFNKLLKEADAETFEIITEVNPYFQLAKDKNYGFWHQDVISLQELESVIKRYKKE